MAAKKRTAPKRSVKGKKQTRSACLPPAPPAPAKIYSVEPRKIPQAAWDHFLQELSERGHVGDAAKAAGIKRITAYKHAETDKAFKTAMEAAHATGMLCLEDEAKRRAVDGIQRGIYYQGVKVATLMEYSDDLLKFLLQGRDSRYKRRQEITGAEGGALMVMLGTMSGAELDAHIAAKEKELAEARTLDADDE